MFIAGSIALKVALGSTFLREPADIDINGTPAEINALCNRLRVPFRDREHFSVEIAPGQLLDFECYGPGSSGALYQKYMDGLPLLRLLPFGGQSHPVAPIEVLYSMKRSHRHYPRNFLKHILDHSLLQVVLGDDKLEHITKVREGETEKRFGKLRTPSLMKSQEDFFTDKVSNRYFIHDEMHRVMAHGDAPMYERLKDNAKNVMCSRAKFESLSHMEKIQCVQEEAYVIALERKIVPAMFGGEPYYSPTEAFEYALMRICTTLTSGWFRDFATNEYLTIFSSSDPDYVTKFLTAVDEKRIIPITQCHVAGV